MRYALTDAEWWLIEPILPCKPRGVRDRRVLNGIFWAFSCVRVRCYQTANPGDDRELDHRLAGAVVPDQIIMLEDLAQKQVRLAHRHTRCLVRRHHRAMMVNGA